MSGASAPDAKSGPTPVWPMLTPSLAKIGPGLAKFGQNRSDSGQAWSNFGQCWSNLVPDSQESLPKCLRELFFEHFLTTPAARSREHFFGILEDVAKNGSGGGLRVRSRARETGLEIEMLARLSSGSREAQRGAPRTHHLDLHESGAWFAGVSRCARCAAGGAFRSTSMVSRATESPSAASKNCQMSMEAMQSQAPVALETKSLTQDAASEAKGQRVVNMGRRASTEGETGDERRGGEKRQGRHRLPAGPARFALYGGRDDEGVLSLSAAT